MAKIDAAFEKIDKLKANAERNLANAKKLFQSALDEAMRPKKGWVEKRLGEVCKVFGRGKSVVSYTPELSDAEKAKRTYITWGKMRLQDKDWTAVPAGSEGEYNFFKVSVEMKKP